MNIRKHIPNAITSMNLLSGIMGVIFALKGRVDLAFYTMLLAAVFDFADGLAARLLEAYSEIGKELDSLADVVSFGVLPAVMLFSVSRAESFAIKCIPLLIASFAALRLAKFNLDERQHEHFIGLPTPAAAMICGSLAYFVTFEPGSNFAYWCDGPVFIPLLSLAICALLVCEVPMFSMKFGGGNKASNLDTKKRILFIGTGVMGIVLAAVAGLNWSVVVLIGFAGYVLINLFFHLFRVS